VIERLRCAVEEGCSQPQRSRRELSPLAAEVIVGGVLAVVRERLQTRPRDLSGLVNQLMWMIVLPYMGPAAAAKELRRVSPRSAAKPTRSTRGPLDGLDMRMTYRTAKVLTAIAEQPGASNVELAASVGVADQGQISKLLSRMVGLGLIENVGAYTVGAANAWRLTPRGREVDAALRRRLAAGAARTSGRRRG
jgi:DNA-binding MarR family transcriptional regulator